MTRETTGSVSPMTTELISISPVLPSQDIDRDVSWYEEHMGFQSLYKDKMYAVVKRGNIYIHLQWHADTLDDPLLGGSVIRIIVKNLKRIYEEFVDKGTLKEDKLKLATTWNTNEFGLYDLNKNAIFFAEDISESSFS